MRKYSVNKWLILLTIIASPACRTTHSSTATTAVMQQPSFDKQGHRGSRGLMPENTIPAMLAAIDLDVITLELDVVISGDNKVVVSHDSHFNERLTTSPEGTFFTKEEALKRLLYTMPYDSIKKYDVGLRQHPDFPDQKKLAVSKPLLSRLIDSCERHATSKRKTMNYNIEIKSTKETDGTHHPAPAEFAELVVAILQQKGIPDRCTIQSFDVRPLQIIHQRWPGITLSLLSDVKEVMEDKLRLLGFTPPLFSPYYRTVTKEMVTKCHGQNMKIIPWTVNTLAEMKALLTLKVDGIISDYPNLFSQL